MLKRLEFVRVPRDEDVYIELPLQQRQAGHVSPRDNLMAVDQPNFELPDGHDFLFRVVQVLELKTLHGNYKSAI